MEYKCLESINSLYVSKTYKGYSTKPCCLWKGREEHFVDNISDLVDNSPALDKIRQGFIGDWKRPECNDCIVNESMGKESKRVNSFKRGNKGIVAWDLRPGHTCNLKCVMCNPWNSSKWYEDVDVYKSFNSRFPSTLKSEDRLSRETLDWDWIYEQCIDKAQRIYIAGGEPFYMKSVYTFLKKLSQHEWNCNNTVIQIQTNGVSNTPKLLNILSKFKKLEFGISVDGWASVNDLIRFPTKHNDFLKNTQELVDLNCGHLYFNITVQAMNLPNVDKLVTKLQETWNGKYDIHNLHNPSHLRIDCLKPSVIDQVERTTQVPELKKFIESYKYNEGLNTKMKNFLLELDAKRGTDSKKIIPWCFE